MLILLSVFLFNNVRGLCLTARGVQEREYCIKEEQEWCLREQVRTGRHVAKK